MPAWKSANIRRRSVVAGSIWELTNAPKELVIVDKADTAAVIAALK